MQQSTSISRSVGLSSVGLINDMVGYLLEIHMLSPIGLFGLILFHLQWFETIMMEATKATNFLERSQKTRSVIRSLQKNLVKFERLWWVQMLLFILVLPNGDYICQLCIEQGWIQDNVVDVCILKMWRTDLPTYLPTYTARYKIMCPRLYL